MPDKANPVPVIDADTVLAGAVFSKGFELKSGALKVLKRCRRVQDGELPISYVGYGVKLPRPDTVQYLFGPSP